MNTSFILLDSDEIIEKKIMREYLTQINKRFTKSQKRTLEQVKDLFMIELANSDTTKSFQIGEQLSKLFGFRAGDETRVINIIMELANKMKLDWSSFKFSKPNIMGSISYYIENKDIEDLILLDSANIITEKGFKLPWLKSLIIDGDTISFAYDYAIIYKPGVGRSDGAIMVPTKTKPWRVPPTYSGTLLNNWFTRVFDSSNFQNGFNTIMERAFS